MNQPLGRIEVGEDPHKQRMEFADKCLEILKEQTALLKELVEIIVPRQYTIGFDPAKPGADETVFSRGQCPECHIYGDMHSADCSQHGKEETA